MRDGNRSWVTGSVLALGAGLALSFATGVTAAHAAAARLDDVARIIELKLRVAESEAPVGLWLHFALAKRGEFFYRAGLDTEGNSRPFHSESEVFGRVTPKRGGGLRLEVLRGEPSVRLTFELASSGAMPRLVAAEKVRLGKPVSVPDSGVEYWADATPTERLGAEAATLLSSGSWVTDREGDRALDEVLLTGKLDFSPCDGCEHSDMILLEHGKQSIDVAPLGLKGYHLEDCPGELHPWLEKLLELKVPFTYRGRLTSITSSLWEGQFWSAIGDASQLSLGSTLKLPLVRTLDRLRAIDEKGTFERMGSSKKLAFRHARGIATLDLERGTLRTDSR